MNKKHPYLPATQSLPLFLQHPRMTPSSSGHFRIADVRSRSASGWHVRRFLLFSPAPQIISADTALIGKRWCFPTTTHIDPSFPEFLLDDSRFGMACHWTRHQMMALTSSIYCSRGRQRIEERYRPLRLIGWEL
ncbi:hypothetical protein HNY73_000533 [Argiope bruennichi]|uniref:Uncharacterized protein n=1 Tax=Argiope bruennichi TaxID=94029 RepID=A0A8T0G0U5_ARGBR|nr:hypothetical protein HNY73_000533 [Argiope bruennichi]